MRYSVSTHFRIPRFESSVPSLTKATVKKNVQARLQLLSLIACAFRIGNAQNQIVSITEYGTEMAASGTKTQRDGPNSVPVSELGLVVIAISKAWLQTLLHGYARPVAGNILRGIASSLEQLT